jgi:hypothetical protein
VCGQHDGHPVAAQRVDQFPHHDAGVGVHACGRLVEEHEFGTTDHCARERQSLLLTPGQPPVGGAGGVGEPERVQ